MWIFWDSPLPKPDVLLNDHVFTNDQLERYNVILNFYGEFILGLEIFGFIEANNSSESEADDLLRRIEINYNTRQHSLQRLFNVDTSRLFYINNIVRRDLFLRSNIERRDINVEDILPYEINKFQLFPEFMSIHNVSQDKINVSFDIFTECIKKLDSIDPYGNLYFTKDIDDEMTKVLLAKFPNYKKYYDEKRKLKEILLDLMTEAGNIKLIVHQIIQFENEKILMRLQNYDGVKDMMKQIRLLQSNRSENMFKRLMDRTIKLNLIIITFNTSFKLQNPKKDKTIDVRAITENIFYSDYLETRASIENRLKQQLVSVIENL